MCVCDYDHSMSNIPVIHIDFSDTVLPIYTHAIMLNSVVRVVANFE